MKNIIKILDANHDDATYWKEEGLRDTIISELKKFRKEIMQDALNQVQELVDKIDPDFHSKVQVYRLKEQGIEINSDSMIFKDKNGEVIGKITAKGWQQHN